MINDSSSRRTYASNQYVVVVGNASSPLAINQPPVPLSLTWTRLIGLDLPAIGNVGDFDRVCGGEKREQRRERERERVRVREVYILRRGTLIYSFIVVRTVDGGNRTICRWDLLGHLPCREPRWPKQWTKSVRVWTRGVLQVHWIRDLHRWDQLGQAKVSFFISLFFFFFLWSIKVIQTTKSFQRSTLLRAEQVMELHSLALHILVIYLWSMLIRTC